MIFYSKKDKFFYSICLFSLAVSLIPAVVTGAARHEMYPALLIGGLMLLLLIWLSRTNYEITQDGRLIIRSLFMRWRVPTSNITSIEKTRILVSSPALARDRLQINYHGGFLGFVAVSPQHEELFLQLLQEQNPKIVVKT